MDLDEDRYHNKLKASLLIKRAIPNKNIMSTHQASPFFQPHLNHNSTEENIFIKRYSLYKNFQMQQRYKSSSPSQSGSSTLPLDKFRNFKHRLKDYLNRQQGSKAGPVFSNDLKRLTENTWYIIKKKRSQNVFNTPVKEEDVETHNAKLAMTKYLLNSSKHQSKKEKGSLKENEDQKKEVKQSIQEIKLPKGTYFVRNRSVSQQQIPKFKEKKSKGKIIQWKSLPIHTIYLTTEGMNNNFNDQKPEVFLANKLQNFAKTAEKKIRDLSRLRTSSQKSEQKHLETLIQSQNSEVLVCSRNAVQIEQLQRRKRQLLHLSKKIQMKKSKTLGLRIKISKKSDADVTPWSKRDLHQEEEMNHDFSHKLEQGEAIP